MGQFVYFVFLVYFILFVLSCHYQLPLQVIALKDSSLKWPIMCRVGRKTLLTHCLLFGAVCYLGCGLV